MLPDKYRLNNVCSVITVFLMLGYIIKPGIMLNDPYHANVPFTINVRRANRTAAPTTK